MERNGLSLRLITIPAIVIAVLTVFVVVNLSRTRSYLDHTQGVTEGLHRLLSSMKYMEVGQRGYLLTRNESYLQIYVAAATDLDTELKTLAELLAIPPPQKVRFIKLQNLVRGRNAEMENTIELGKAGRFDLALAVVGTGVGRRTMESIRVSVNEMRAEENRSLTLLLKRVYGLVYGLAGFLAACAALIATALWQLRVKVGELTAARSALQAAYDDLEDQVRARTADLARKTEELARTNQELERFAYMASHDLQEPLRKISMMTDLLSRPGGLKDAASHEKFANVIQADANRMRDMIVGMLSLSRVGAKEVPKEPVDTAKAVDAALKNLEVAVAEAKAKISRGFLPSVIANETQMQQVFQNLIGNALKFRGERSTEITIGAEPEGAFWRFQVRDNGIGLDPAYAERIFEAFERLHGKEHFAGSGLGLAICKKIVESSGGRIWVDGRPDEGATFYFTLPAKA